MIGYIKVFKKAAKEQMESLNVKGPMKKKTS